MYKSVKKLINPIEPVTEHFESVDIALVKQLFSIQTPSGDRTRQDRFLNFILNWLKVNGVKVVVSYDAYGNMYLTKGKSKIFPCVVSHIDTVHDYNKDLEIVNTSKLIFGIDSSSGEQHGIGADPKNGVYFVMQMLKHVPNIKAVLFLDEEIGCVGSSQSDVDFFKNCSFVCQLDRRSFTNDFIEYTNGIQTVSNEFKSAVRPILDKYHYDFNRGTCTDVGELVHSGINICGFNFSNGSFNEHYEYETCSIPHLLNAVNAAYEIITKLSHKQWKHIPEKEYRKTKGKGGFTDAWDDDYWNWYNEPKAPPKTIVTEVKPSDPVLEVFIKDYVFGGKANDTLQKAALGYAYNKFTVYYIRDLWNGFSEVKISDRLLRQSIKDYMKRYVKNTPAVDKLVTDLENLLMTSYTSTF